MCVGIGFSDQTLILNHEYPISSNNSHPSINYLGPQIITPAEGSIIASSNNRPPPTPLVILSFFYTLPVKLKWSLIQQN